MNMLDKLFSREIQRRTGAHAIKIYIDSQTATRSKAQKLGSRALKLSIQKPKKSPKTKSKKSKNSHSSNLSNHANYPDLSNPLNYLDSSKNPATNPQKEHNSLFHRLDVRLPWLKLAAVCIIGLIVVLDLCNVTISKIGDPYDKIKIAPMAYHVRATERTLEGKMLVALTFDDGPSDTTTPRLLDVLAEKDVPATFFMLGNMARSNPDIVKRIKKEGHDVASHTTYHQNLVRIPATAAQSDINESKAIFNSILGQDPKYTRPPYGNHNDVVRSLVGTPIILWSVDTLDWQSKNPEAIVATAMSEVYDGAIILMHDIYPTSVDAIPSLIDTMRQSGYEFVTVSELAKARKATLTPGTVYYNIRP